MPAGPTSQAQSGVPTGSATGDSWSKPASEQASNTKDKKRPDPSGAPDDPDDGDVSSAPTSEIRSMLRQRIKKDGDGSRPKSSLGSVRIEEYYGERSRYIKWKRTIQAQQCLYGLENQELAMLVYLSTRKEARDVVEQHPVTSYTGPGGLALLWKVLDEAFGESETELFERADKELERYRRGPGESIPHYLAEMRRLKAQYMRVDPDTRLSDRAWAQKLLHKASLSRKERYDVYYSAGAVYDPTAIEKALRVRCAHLHHDERRTPSRTPHREREKEDEVRTYKKKKVFIKKRIHGSHVADATEEGEDDDEMPEEEGGEEEPQGQPGEDEEGDYEEEEDNMTSDGEMDAGDLKEAFAAGWKAKQKVADIKKQRGWKGTEKDKKGEKTNIDARKKATTCSSCGKQGHWRGDPECVNVVNGRDQPHRKASTVHFTFVAGSDDPRERQCPQCHWPTTGTAKFCGECGFAMPPLDDRMSSQVKREGGDWSVVGEGGGDERPEGFGFSVRKESVVGAKPKPKAKGYAPPGHVRLKGQELLAALPSMTKEDKKELHKALQKEEDEETEKRRDLFKRTMSEYSYWDYETYEPTARELFPDGAWKYQEWRARQEAEHDPRASASEASGSQGPAPPPPRSDRPKAVKDKELEAFRWQLYQKQVRHGRRIPSTAADWPTEAQSLCAHPFENLRWSANAEGHFARCKLCDQKHVIYFSNRHGAMMVHHHSPTSRRSWTTNQGVDS